LHVEDEAWDEGQRRDNPGFVENDQYEKAQCESSYQTKKSKYSLFR
jgi:hypothetical protein